MPTIANTPTVSVSVPVPTPVQSKSKTRPPVSFGTDDVTTPLQSTAPQIPSPPRRRMTAVILPWSPPPKMMSRLPKRVIRYTERVIRYSIKRNILTWKTFSGDEYSGEIIGTDNGTVIVRMLNGKERAVRCDQPESKHIVDRANEIELKNKIKKKMKKLPNKVARFFIPYPKSVRYMRQEVDHEPFHAKIAENPREHTSSLVYADFLEEHGMSELAAFIREAVRLQSPSYASYLSGNDKRGNIMLYSSKPNPEPPDINSVYAYKGLGKYGEQKRFNPKPKPTVQVEVKSPFQKHYGDFGGHLSFALDLPQQEAHDWMRRLISEGHPAGNANISSTLGSIVQEYQSKQQTDNSEGT